MLRMPLFIAALTFVGIVGLALAQTESATIAGKVVDASGGVVAGARVEIHSIERGTLQATKTTGSGVYVFSNVRPGQYRMSVRHDGYREIDLRSLIVNVQDRVEENFRLQVGSVSESITVEASGTPIGVSGTVGTVIDQQIIHDAPLNGRSFQTLFQQTPGVVITQATGENQGQFSVNGQRTDSNYFTIDGASANSSISAGAQPGPSLGGNLPALGATGGTNSLVSVDAVQEFAIQTSSFAPEYGRTPGAQVSIVTKSGTNEFHGNVFNYLRNDIVDANDWFADHNGIKKAALRQNDFGGTLGGPIYKDKTFFFFSYEGLRLRQPTTTTTDVPTLAARSAAPAPVQPILNAFPRPTGPDEGNGLALAVYSISNPSTLNATSLRLDHHFTPKVSAFVRYNFAPSNTITRGSQLVDEPVNNLTFVNFSLETLTVGLTQLVSAKITNDVRLNWTKSIADNFYKMDTFGGAQIIPAAQMQLPAPYTLGNSNWGVFISGASRGGQIILGKNSFNTQSQLNVVDNLSLQRGTHFFRFGVDYRHLSPNFSQGVYDQEPVFETIANVLALTPDFAITGLAAPVEATYNNYSLYGQDAWNPIAGLSITYGLRWDYNAAPSSHSPTGLQPIIVRDVNDLAHVHAEPVGTPLYHAALNNLAPRFGFSYVLHHSGSRETVLKGGAGMFYDFASAPFGYAYSESPFVGGNFFVPAAYPLSASEVRPVPLTQNPPYVVVLGSPSHPKTPYTYQWNLAIEQALGHDQRLSVGYVGAAAHSLLHLNEFLSGIDPAFSQQIWFVDNSGYSNHNSLQAQYRRRTSNGLDLLASYTFAHTLDNGSSDASLTVPGQLVDPRVEYGPSDFDIRHTGTFALSYHLPSHGRSWLSKAFVNGWGLSPVFTARSAPPVNVLVQHDVGFGALDLRPDVVAGVPLIVRDATAPGGRRINTEALLPTTTLTQGTLRRNALRGFPLVQLDLAVHRRFALTERLGLDASLDAFNLLNHPNFAPPDHLLGSVDPFGSFTPRNGFGVSSSLLNRGLSTAAGFGAGFSPLYQVGGPRSLQIALKLEF